LRKDSGNGSGLAQSFAYGFQFVSK